MPRGAGPYKVVARINDNAYKIDLPSDEFGVSHSFNVADLSPYFRDDLASRMMPFTLYKRLLLEKIIPTYISLQMVDKSTAIPVGICEDVPVQVANNCLILTNFLCWKCMKMIICLLFLGDLFLTLQGLILIATKEK